MKNKANKFIAYNKKILISTLFFISFSFNSPYFYSHIFLNFPGN